MNAVELITKAGELVGGDRAKQHGDMRENFANIARLWNAYLAPSYLGKPTIVIDSSDVGHMMALLKIARTQSGALKAGFDLTKPEQPWAKDALYWIKRI